MSATLDDIWDAPVEPSSPRRPSASDAPQSNTPERSERPLFLASDSEDDEPKTRKRTPQTKKSARPDIDAMFDNLDDDENAFQPLAPALDMNALQREAEQRHARSSQGGDLHAILPSSSPGREQSRDMADSNNENKKSNKDGPKERKVLPKLDEARLLGPNGFPALIAEAKKFKPRGKGQEATDLNRVIQLYQFWAHKMYPKMQFRDTVNRVEKLCHSKRMHVALSVWRDEAKGLVNGMKPDDPIDLVSDSDEDDADDGERTKPDGRQSLGRDVGGASDARSRAPSRPPSSPSIGQVTDVDDFDIDAMIREEQEMEADRVPAPQDTHRPTEGATAGDDMDIDDEAMWAEMMMEDAGVPSIPPVPTSIKNTDDNTTAAAAQTGGASVMDDEDMWDVVREMELESQKPGSSVAAGPETLPSEDHTTGPSSEGLTSSPQRKRRMSNADDWDDMYV
ncbi:Swi3-domain-containing protein [Gloeophyllum trabeum ATCC 11539]|uniref:Chromosome segregation in meiosis protein n=1 Tax=Gloeophyllum trabeum (strain ATCC 11539 / FP-39264 / Madison 617) TaxID=670483 RepID=S7RXF1_GLOTA|nr:Swi3-domain-containing protein [Gloeophyllum trabeum ATCC 11539]EPQ58019.1 Swi3-domain-containing protein [Gloeophyllum trabeum ATCC 11539]